jgi:signal transduction histidine kinase
MDLDFLNEDDNTQLVVMVTKIVRGSLNEVKGLLKEVFPEVTDDELKHTKIKELVDLIIEIVKFTFTGIADVGKKKIDPLENYEVEQDNKTILESLFEVEVGISQQFSSISPLSLRKERAVEVFLFIRRYLNYLKMQPKKKDKPKKVMRPAGDDWF